MFKDSNTTLLPVGVPPAFLPGAYYNPLPNATAGKLMTPTQIILHTNAGPKSSGWRNLFIWSSRTWDSGDRGVTQPHFQVQEDGTIGQGIPMDRQGVHARFANVRAIGIETQDPGTDSVKINDDPWEPAQLDALVRICTHACLFYNIPPKFPDAWDQPGIGWHSQFGYPQWTKYKGKECPGRMKISQMLELVTRVNTNVETVRKYFGNK